MDTQSESKLEPQIERTERTRLKRYAERANYERADIYAVLDEALVCHMGFTVDEQPYVIPTLCARVDDALYLHGSAASRALRTMKGAARVCVTATLIDGLVLARSAFFHSVNYRSVVVLGEANPTSDSEEKLLALEHFTNTIVAGRWSDVRPPTRQELKGTEILRLELNEASLKSRNGPPSDLPEDLERDTWSGVIPIATQLLPLIPDPTLREGIEPPQYVSDFATSQRAHPYADSTD